jgi:hypothetical protein
MKNQFLKFTWILILASHAWSQPKPGEPVRPDDYEVTRQSFAQMQKVSSAGAKQVLFGYRIIPYEDFENQPYAGLLTSDEFKAKDKKETEEIRHNIQPTDKVQPMLVFEGRALFKIPISIEKVKPKSLFTIQQMRRLGGHNTHTPLSNYPQFASRTRVDFPIDWTVFIIAAKEAGKIKADGDEDCPLQVPCLFLESRFDFFSRENIQSVKSLQDVASLSPLPTTPDAMTLQTIYYVNHLMEFGSIATFFYGQGSQTVVYVVQMYALKKKLLDTYFNFGGLVVNGRKALIGKATGFSSSSGIGAGLPGLSEELLTDLANGLNDL